jgi:hypothetical protein
MDMIVQGRSMSLFQGLAAMVDEVDVGGEHPVREPVVAHELPDVLGGVELRAFRREHDERDVVRNREAGREVPSALVEDKHGVFAGGDLGGDLGEVQVHRLGVAGGQNERGSLAIAGADRAEDIGGSGALIVRRRGPRAASCPAPGDLLLLPDPSLIREPELYPVAIDLLVARDRVQALGKGFLKASAAPAAWA